MSKKNAQDQQFSRLIDALLAPVRQFAGDQIELTLTAAYDALQILDRKVTRKNIKRHHSTILSTAAALVKCAETFKSNSYNPLRNALINNAVNLVMLVVESLAAEGDKEASDALFTTAYEYCKLMADWDEKFPRQSVILGSLGFNEHEAPVKMLANVRKSRLRLQTHHDAIEKMLSRIDSNLSLVEHILREIESTRHDVLRLFEWDCGDHVLKFRAETPWCFRTAESYMAAVQKHIDGIDRKKADQATVNRSARAILIASMVQGYVKASLAHAYVEYWKGADGLQSYYVLAHQALAYSEACTGNNFTYFAPLAFIRQNEPITERSEAWIRMLIRYGDASFSYAQCLHAQMLVKANGHSVSRPKKVRKPKRLAAKPVTVAEFPSINGYVADKEGVTQEELASSHCYETGQDLRENHWLGIGRREYLIAKQRLVGFGYGRGGRIQKKKRQQRRKVA